MLSPDFDLRDGDDDSQVWGRRPSNLETELQQMQDVSQLYHNPAYPTTDLRRWLQKGSIWSKVPAVTTGRKSDDVEVELERMIDGCNDGPEVGPMPCTAAPAVGAALPSVGCQPVQQTGLEVALWPLQAYLLLRPHVQQIQVKMA